MRYLATALLPLLLCPLADAAEPAFMLVCHMSTPPDNKIVDANMYVDPATSTVNGHPARIYEAEIRWDSAADGYRYDNRINRYTGRIGVITTGPDGNSWVMGGECVTGLHRKF